MFMGFMSKSEYLGSKVDRSFRTWEFYYLTTSPPNMVLGVPILGVVGYILRPHILVYVLTFRWYGWDSEGTDE